jgi:hypothetical protein
VYWNARVIVPSVDIVAEAPTKFRGDGVVIEAIQFNGLRDYWRIAKWMEKSGRSNAVEVGYLTPGMSIQTLEGCMSASPGDWIIKGVEGEFYPCKPDIFEATYDRVESMTNAER